MSWYATVRANFFDEWSRQGLPEAPLDKAGKPAWRPLPCPLLKDDAITSAGPRVSPQSRALAPGVLQSVYGFGVFTGEMCGHLYGVSASSVRSRADFCGRFNLGISLFDFICDEGRPGEFEALQNLPSLRLFTGAPGRPVPNGNPTLRYLDRIAESVLAELSDELGPPRRSGLWHAMFAMFAAQLKRARTRTAVSGDGKEMRKALRLSSSEPFRVMSEWIARGGSTSPPTLRSAAALGRCIGDCYWLIDDAKDVWDDLYAGRWNRFLLDAKVAEPALPLHHPTPFLETRLLDIWRIRRTAERATRYTVGRLARALERLALSPRRARPPMERLHASLADW